MTRRSVLEALAGFILTPEGLWQRTKLISIPQTIRRTVCLELSPNPLNLKTGDLVRFRGVLGVVSDTTETPHFREAITPGLRFVLKPTPNPDPPSGAPWQVYFATNIDGTGIGSMIPIRAASMNFVRTEPRE